MKKNTKGFTLIELLAVIVILAIIALIATPIVLNIINRARKSAAADSAYSVRKEAELYYAFESMSVQGVTDDIWVKFESTGITVTDVDGNTYTPHDSDNNFELGGTVPSDGMVQIKTDGKIQGQVKIGSYWCAVRSTGEIKCFNDYTSAADIAE